MNTNSEVNSKRFYEDFEPPCLWKRDQGHDLEALEVHLQGFKKEQLRVQFNNSGILTISGERAVDETKWSRFNKEIRVSNHCNNKDEIRAKFSRGILYITMGGLKKEGITSTSRKNSGLLLCGDSSKQEQSQNERRLMEKIGRIIKMNKKMASVSASVMMVGAAIAIGGYIIYWKHQNSASLSK